MTYASPKEKRQHSVILFATLTFSFQSSGTGIRKTKKSDRMLIKFATIPKGRRLIQ